MCPSEKKNCTSISFPAVWRQSSLVLATCCSHLAHQTSCRLLCSFGCFWGLKTTRHTPDTPTNLRRRITQPSALLTWTNNKQYWTTCWFAIGNTLSVTRSFEWCEFYDKIRVILQHNILSMRCSTVPHTKHLHCLLASHSNTKVPDINVTSCILHETKQVNEQRYSNFSYLLFVIGSIL